MNTMTTTLRRSLYALLLLAAALLQGCGLPRMIDSDVQSFVGADGAVTGVGYRFERLPSQQANANQQDTLERMAERPLSEVGLHRDDTAPRYSVQVSLSVQAIAPPPQHRSRSERLFWRPDGPMLYPPLSPLLLEPPWFNHSVHVVLRTVDNARAVFESSASFDGPWSDSANIVPVMLRAALRDYPAPPTGLRKIVIELPATTGSQDE